MEMCYDETLVMPSNYATMSEEEMMYVDGGKIITITLAGVGLALGKKLAGFCARKVGALLLANAGKIATWFLGTGFFVQALVFTAAGIILASAMAFGITLVANKKITIRI